MKKIRIVFLLFFIVLVSIASVKAEVHPPSPVNAKSAGVMEDEGPPTPDPVRGPIDENIILLLVAGLALGTVVVYKNKIKKASI